ncbi:MAG TPA: ATP-binding protein [Candidatus Acidoferrum sp.]|jgi:signal transduction histidine kinase|nr:ATP-binding protein [Candidatus Acidoferrum sp.]
MKTATRRKGKLENFEEEYRTALRSYSAEGGELALGRAYELGRRALEEQLSVVDLASLHHRAVIELVRETENESQKEERLRISAEFLAECISPYEMAHRGFQDAVRALRQLNETLEEEIKRIAYAVHDEAGQLLVAVHLALAEVAMGMPEEQQAQFTRIKDLLNEVEKHLRRYSHELRPTILDDLGWIPAVRFLADGVSKRASLPIHIDATVSGRLPTAIETTLYRIVQEALTNAVKHAKASNVWIRAWREDFTQCCSIRDDGAGFKASRGQRAPRKGLGLVAMRERVSAIGGTLQIESRPGHGTEISIRLPLEGSDADTNRTRG